MMKLIGTFLFWAVFYSQVLGQTQGYFASPVKHKIKMSGSYGELRKNHFHAGIDLKSSKGVSGDPIYASADGHVSRIKVQEGGYGNVLYIDHDNGYTTVYAHLLEFYPEISNYVKKKQYELQSFEVDLYPEHQNFWVRQGAVIGKMGNTGHSYGPHLHFEIRRTADEVPENPYLHGIGASDSRKPLIQSINIVSYDSNYNEVKSRSHKVLKGKSGLYIKGHASANTSSVGIEVKTYDKMDGASNLNGTYRIQMYVDDVKYYDSQLDRIPFHHMKYINSHTNYCQYIDAKSWYIRCHRLPGNILTIYNERLGDGIIHMDDTPKKIKILATDFAGNTSELKFDLKKASEHTLDHIYTKYIRVNQQQQVQLQSSEITFAPHSLDRDLYLDYDEEWIDGELNISIAKSNVAIFQPVKVRIDLRQMDSLSHDLILISDKKKVNYGGTLEGSYLTTYLDRLGDFRVVRDNKKPEIRYLKRKRIRDGWRYSFKVADNYPTRLKANKLQYDAYINDKWILSKLRTMNHRLTVDVKDLAPGVHKLRIEAVDHSGNKAVYTRNIKI